MGKGFFVTRCEWWLWGMVGIDGRIYLCGDWGREIVVGGELELDFGVFVWEIQLVNGLY